MKLKCLSCGCEREFVDIKLAEVLILSDCGNYSQTVKAYACTECGFVQLYDKEQVNKRLKEMKNEEEFSKKLEEYNNKISALQEEIKKTQVIIEDENQTVKTVREAKDRLVKLKNELEWLKGNRPLKK